MTEANILKKNWSVVKNELEKRKVNYQVLGDGYNIWQDHCNSNFKVINRPDMIRIKTDMSGTKLHKLLQELGLNPPIPGDYYI
jgi:hypothetical protein